MFDLFLTFILNLFESLAKILKNEPKQIDYDKKPTPPKNRKIDISL